jgi:hypothetical protein
MTGLIERRFLCISALGITNARYFRIIQKPSMNTLLDKILKQRNIYMLFGDVRRSARLEAGAARAVAGLQPFPRSEFRRVLFNLTEVRLPVFDLAIFFSPFGGQVFQ